jgi:hypothetical protein
LVLGQALAARARTVETRAEGVAPEIAGAVAADGDTCAARSAIAELSATAAMRDAAIRALATPAASARRWVDLNGDAQVWTRLPVTREVA